MRNLHMILQPNEGTLKCIFVHTGQMVKI